MCGYNESRRAEATLGSAVLSETVCSKPVHLHVSAESDPHVQELLSAWLAVYKQQLTVLLQKTICLQLQHTGVKLAEHR